jgi:hypothetical protein
MINGVLVERTVADVIPALVTNSDGLKNVLGDLLKQYKQKQDELEKWKVEKQCIALIGDSAANFLVDYRKRTTFKLCSRDNRILAASCLAFAVLLI